MLSVDMLLPCKVYVSKESQFTFAFVFVVFVSNHDIQHFTANQYSKTIVADRRKKFTEFNIFSEQILF